LTTLVRIQHSPHSAARASLLWSGSVCEKRKKGMHRKSCPFLGYPVAQRLFVSFGFKPWYGFTKGGGKTTTRHMDCVGKLGKEHGPDVITVDLASPCPSQNTPHRNYSMDREQSSPKTDARCVDVLKRTSNATDGMAIGFNLDYLSSKRGPTPPRIQHKNKGLRVLTR